jgi:hypothetical protein
MTATARQIKDQRSRDNCQFVRALLAERQPELAAALRSAVRVAGYPSELRDHAFGRAGCALVDGEPLLAARARGYAAECAANASEAIRDGDLIDARALLHAALTYLDTRDVRMVTA